MCRKLPKDEPNFCPQQIIQNSYENLDNESFRLPSKHRYVFNPDQAFWKLTEIRKKRAIGKYVRQKKQFLSKCIQELEPYDGSVKTICNHIDSLLPKDSPLATPLKTLCSDIYCTYILKDGEKMVTYRKDPEKLPFCKKLVSNPEEDYLTPVGDVITRTVQIGATTFAVLLLLFLIYKGVEYAKPVWKQAPMVSSGGGVLMQGTMAVLGHAGEAMQMIQHATQSLASQK